MKRLFCVALILLCTSCGMTGKTFKSYPGDKRPASEIAILTTQKGNISYTEVLIDNLNGKYYFLNSVELLPGEHFISVQCKDNKFWLPRLYRDTLKFKVIAGHSYNAEFRDKQFCLKDLTENTNVTCGDTVKGTFWYL